MKEELEQCEVTRDTLVRKTRIQTIVVGLQLVSVFHLPLIRGDWAHSGQGNLHSEERQVWGELAHGQRHKFRPLEWLNFPTDVEQAAHDEPLWTSTFIWLLNTAKFGMLR